MFVRQNTWKQLTDDNTKLKNENETLTEENSKLKEELERIDERRNTFETIFYNTIDRMLDCTYQPKPVDPDAPHILFQTRITDIVPEEIEKVLAEMDSSFSDRVLELIREKGLNEVDVYKKADLDRRLFSKLRSFSEYRPTKDTALLLCLSMELSLTEAADLLSRAGLAFSKHSKTDLIANFFLNRKIYDVQLYKEVLYKYGCLHE